MICIAKKEQCTGCALCQEICPSNCIRMIRNHDGFYVPTVDMINCISCGLCFKKCPVNHMADTKSNVYEVIAAQLKDKEKLKKSASGGVAWGISQSFLKQGGRVVGVIDNISEGAKFHMIDTSDDLSKMVGSKYYQCDLTHEIFTCIRSTMNKNIPVLFIGTPCQVKAVKTYLKPNELNNLFAIDILCQGVPSKKVVDQYHKYLMQKKSYNIAQHYYRNKDKLINNEYTTKIVYENGCAELRIGQEDLYTRAFCRNIFLRESCYRCKYTNTNRVGDITIGDFWGYQGTDIDQSLGVSLVIQNTEKGAYLFDVAKEKFIYSKSNDLEEAVSHNLPLRRSVKRPMVRAVSYRLLDCVGFAMTTRILCYKYYLKKIVNRISEKNSNYV